MATCRVSYADRDGIHSVEVSADTLFEAVAQALVDFKEDKTILNPPGQETEFAVKVIREPTEHFIRLKRVREWAEFSNTTSPMEKLRREKVRKLLAS
jgi:hypothetical protein